MDVRQKWNKILGITFLTLCLASLCAAQIGCEVPFHFQGDWFSMEGGLEVDTVINANSIDNRKFTGTCIERRDHNETADTNGWDSDILFHDLASNCYKCYAMLHRTPNLAQYKQTDCRSPSNGQPPSLESVCSDIAPHTDMATFFRKTMKIVNCKNTFEGTYHFTYEWVEGGGGICNSPWSRIVACQEPGSPYVDNQVFTMRYGKCPDVSTSTDREIKFQCMGTWQDDEGNVWSGVADLGRDIYRERFRCMLTRFDQEESLNKRRYSMSWWADCSQLKSPYEGPLRLLMEPVIGDLQMEYSEPQCNFPTNYAGHWYHTGELDVDVDINMTHIYFNTKFDQFSYKESYFVCMMQSGTRYLTVAITVGKCEIDYVCFDALPRHHSIIRWRMGKPYRLTAIERAYPNYKMYMFRQACSWSSFTINREEINWNYNTFLLNPPVPIPCPVRGRFQFTQKGPETELFRTRIRGITERPRHMIDCRHYVTELKSCDENPSKLMVDAEYCETVDHTGSPISEYDEPDWEMTCVGHWDEDWNSYLITYDPEDPTSAFRCWNYERQDWRHIWISRSVAASCSPAQSSRSFDPEEGASLALDLTESERQYDDCAMQYTTDRLIKDRLLKNCKSKNNDDCAMAYIDGDPWQSVILDDNVIDFKDEESRASGVSISLFRTAILSTFIVYIAHFVDL